MPQLRTKLSERTSSSRVSKPKGLRDVPPSLLAMFSRGRDDPSCSKEARATFDELADTAGILRASIQALALATKRVFRRALSRRLAAS
jgi:hypothetical protein